MNKLTYAERRTTVMPGIRAYQTVCGATTYDVKHGTLHISGIDSLDYAFKLRNWFRDEGLNRSEYKNHVYRCLKKAMKNTK